MQEGYKMRLIDEIMDLLLYQRMGSRFKQEGRLWHPTRDSEFRWLLPSCKCKASIAWYDPTVSRPEA